MINSLSASKSGSRQPKYVSVKVSRSVIFSSLEYLLFLPIVTLIYWRTSGALRLWILVGASYFFYMSWMPIYGLLLFALSFSCWLFGLFIDRCRDNIKLVKGIFLSGLFLNLACLCYYKYSNFFLSNLTGVWSWVRQQFVLLPDWHSPALNIILPLGISFFVFEFIHYLVDVYQGNKPINTWMKFAAFASFFPSQIAGPIKRYQDFVQKLDHPEQFSWNLFAESMTLILQGLFKKIAIADPIGNIIAPAYASSCQLSNADALICTIGFAIQIFCDFSGYTDIGRGSALLLGIRLPINFDLPYIAQDLALFWRRWHISLSFWIRDYVYIPLGGSRGSHARNLWNLFLTMSVCGLWHGAAWQFIVWGSSHGLGLIVNRQWRLFLDKFPAWDKTFTNPVIKAFNICLTFTFVALAFVLFRAPDFAHAANIWCSLFNPSNQSICIEPMLKSGVLSFAFVYLGYWIFCDLLKNIRHTGELPLIMFSRPIRAAAWTGGVFLMLAAKPVEATPFIYFQF